MGLFTARNPANAQLERLFRELGWGIDERDGDRYVMYFKGDSVRPRRDVSIMPGGNGAFYSFWTTLPKAFSPRSLPDDLPAALLLRNPKVHCGGWAAHLDDDGDVFFLLRYATPIAGVDAAFVRHICTSMLEELAVVEHGLAKRGLL